MESTGADDESGSSVKRTVTSLRVIAYVCWGVAALTFLSVLCLFTRIRLAIAILKAAADYVKDTPSVFLYAPFNVIVLILFYGYWGITAVYLVSSGDAKQIGNSAFGTFEFDKKLQRLLIYHVFALLWFNAFVIASTQFVLASSTCLWYFSQGTGQKSVKTIRKSIYRLLRYHLGSIAFGSLILAIVQMIRLVLAYMQAQAKKLAGKEGRVIKFALACLQCYAGCFERFIKFLNKNAYIQIALTGKNFCSSAKDGFFLVLRNPLRFGVVSGIGSIFVMFGKVFIAAITALAGFIAITKWDHFNKELYSPFIPVAIIFVFAYAIGAVFMSIYGLAADAILACFVVDEELAKRRNAPPRHCPDSLKNFLDKNKKA
jgi:choline transporter-like protein 2/4/5